MDCGGSFKLDQIYDTGPHPGASGTGQKLVDKIYDIGAVTPEAGGYREREQPGVIAGHSGNVTAILGKPAILNCRVAGVGNKTVSWIRHQDTHLLTAGRSVV